MMRKQIAFGLAVAAFLLVGAAALRYARGLEIIGPESADRMTQVMIGLTLAAYGNVMPKDVGRWRGSARAAAASQSALRVGGWSMTLAGLGYAAFSAFTPIAFANVASIVVVAAATLVTAAYGARAFFVCRRSEDYPTMSPLERDI